MITLLIFLVILSILVLVHEFGHFIVAKKAGIKVEEFGLGLPPKIWSKKIGETIYSLNALPIGGFVKLYGEDGLTGREGERAREQERAYYHKSKKARMAVVVAGVIMNLLLAFVVFSIVYAKQGIPVETNRVTVVGVLPNSPAETTGLKVNDVIISADSQKITLSSQFIEIAKKANGQKLILEIDRQNDNPCNQKVLGAIPGMEITCRNGKMLTSITPRVNPPNGEGPLGVVISQTEMKFYPFFEQMIRGFGEGFKEALGWVSLIVVNLRDMVSQLVRGSVPKDVAGPVGIFQITGTVSKGGLLPLAQFLAILSVNLAVMNILPLPALDGGRALFIVIEAVTKKRVKQELETKIHNIGMIALLTLMLLISINDIVRILKTSGIIDKLQSLFKI